LYDTKSIRDFFVLNWGAAVGSPRSSRGFGGLSFYNNVRTVISGSILLFIGISGHSKLQISIFSIENRLAVQRGAERDPILMLASLNKRARTVEGSGVHGE